MNGGYRYHSHDLARVLDAWGSALGDQTSAHVEGSVLELRRTWDLRVAGGWVLAALALGGASALAVICLVVIQLDRFAHVHEVLASLLPAVVMGVLGVRHARPKKTVVDRATRSLWSRGKKGALDPPALLLTRHQVDTNAFDVRLALRHGGTVLRLGRVRASEAARTKAIAVALAAWLDASLVETTSEATLEALHDADARHGLVLPRRASDTPVVSKARARARKKVANSVDVAVVAIELLNAL